MSPNVSMADNNTAGSGIEFGTEIAMSFKIPDLDDPVYGKATGLTGEFPLFTPYGFFPTSNYFLKEKDEAERILSTYVARARHLLLDLDEVKLEAVVNSYLMLGMYLLPMREVEGPAVRFMFDTVVTSFYFDDIVDVAEDLTDLNITCQAIYKRQSSWQKLFAGEYEEFAKFGLFFPIVAKGWDYLVASCKEAEGEIPDFRSKSRYCARAWLDAMASTPLLIGLHLPGTRHSEESFKLIRGYNEGMQCTLELALDFNGAQVSEYVRNSILYRNLMGSFNIVSGLLNDILGLAKDVKEGLTNDSVILRKVINEGINLQESFRQASESITYALNDMMVSLDLLQSTFPDDEQIPKFCQTFRYYADGQIYAYKAWAKVRYGNVTMDVKAVAVNGPEKA